MHPEETVYGYNVQYHRLVMSRWGQLKHQQWRRNIDGHEVVWEVMMLPQMLVTTADISVFQSLLLIMNITNYSLH